MHTLHMHQPIPTHSVVRVVHGQYPHHTVHCSYTTLIIHYAIQIAFYVIDPMHTLPILCPYTTLYLLTLYHYLVHTLLIHYPYTINPLPIHYPYTTHTLPNTAHTLPCPYTTLTIHFPQTTLLSLYSSQIALYQVQTLQSNLGPYTYTCPYTNQPILEHYPAHTLPCHTVHLMPYTTLSTHYSTRTLLCPYTTLITMYPTLTLHPNHTLRNPNHILSSAAKQQSLQTNLAPYAYSTHTLPYPHTLYHTRTHSQCYATLALSPLYRIKSNQIISRGKQNSGIHTLYHIIDIYA